MTRVVALVAWSNGTITMEEKGVYEIDDALATDLIAQGLCADAATYFGGGSSGGGGVLVVHDVEGTLDKTWQEIANALGSTGAVIAWEHEGVLNSVYSITSADYDQIGETYNVVAAQDSYSTASASGYPVLNE